MSNSSLKLSPRNKKWASPKLQRFKRSSRPLRSLNPLPAQLIINSNTSNHSSVQLNLLSSCFGPHQSALSHSTDLSYRVFVGKHNLVETELGSKAILPETIIVHEKWNPIFVALG